MVTGGAIPVSEADMRRWINRSDLLDKVENGQIKWRGLCLFFIPELKACSIHEIKPDVCRNYDCEGRHF